MASFMASQLTEEQLEQMKNEIEKGLREEFDAKLGDRIEEQLEGRAEEIEEKLRDEFELRLSDQVDDALDRDREETREKLCEDFEAMIGDRIEDRLMDKLDEMEREYLADDGRRASFADAILSSAASRAAMRQRDSGEVACVNCKCNNTR